LKVILIVAAVATALISFGTMRTSGQVFAVGADGKMQQEKPASVIAPENQATAAQLSKLFEVMRIKQQMQSMKAMVPGTVQQQIQAAMKQTEEVMPAGSRPTPELRDKM